MSLRTRMIQTVGLIVVAALFLVEFVPEGSACTGICVRPKDGSFIAGRTMEFAFDLHSAVIVIPRGMEYVGDTPTGKPGLKWTTKYAAVGTNMYGVPHIIDGLNEKGLAFEAFLFPGFAKYQTVPAGQESKAMAMWESGTYILTTCATIDEAIESLKNIFACDVPLLGNLPSMPAHCIIRDASGRSVVIEYLDGKLYTYENPIGIITNSPPFEWHMTNLRNYVGMSVLGAAEVDLSGVRLAPLGQGSGMMGLPGDFTPPSRFVRAVAFSQSALPVDKADDGVLQVFHILNLFDIPLGSTRAKDGKDVISERTSWTSVLDLKNRKYYFRTFDNSEIRMVDLAKCDADAKEVRAISMDGKEKIRDMTGDSKALSKFIAATQPAK